ncbi:hypothetical protein GCM10010492_72460 [Saccharothrix mutabilis subsp. mutabilis]|uniref:Uncharacterized protein n=1 Tax=Saccharothrix mutabilis subsp. mutabilis TaxID=66855 RepID=A0ABN0UTE4_9PSEU
MTAEMEGAEPRGQRDVDPERAAEIERHRRTLATDPRDFHALRALASVVDNVDEACHLYRRAAAVRVLDSDDYHRWLTMVAATRPPRTIQWGDALCRLREQRPESADTVLVLVADTLSRNGALAAAGTAVEEVDASANLQPAVRHQLVVVAGRLLATGGPWEGHYEARKNRITDFMRDSHPPTLLEGARLAVVNRDLGYAKLLLGDVEARADEQLRKMADALRAFIALDEDDYGEVLLRVRDPGSDDIGTELRLAHAIALHGLGQLDDARRRLTRLLSELAPTATEARTDDDRFRLELRVRTLLALAMVQYDLGDFESHWATIRLVAETNTDDLPVPIQAVVLVCRCNLGVPSAEDALLRLDRLAELPGLAGADVETLDLIRAEARLLLAARSAEPGAHAESSARETLSRLRWTAVTSARPTSARAAYAAVLVGDDDVAGLLVPQGETRTGDWRLDTLRAIVSVRKSEPGEAVELLKRVLEDRRHDLDRRCLLVQAELAAGLVDAAVRDAEAVIRFAPGHLTGRLLHAESLLAAASADGADDYPLLVKAAKEFAEVLRLQQGLTDHLAGRTTGVPIASELLPRSEIPHVARQFAVAAVRATWVLAKAGLPVMRSEVRGLGNQAVAGLAVHDGEEAKRFGTMLGRIRRTVCARATARPLYLVVGTAMLALAVFGGWPVNSFSAASPARIGALVLAGVAFFLPYIRKVQGFGVAFELAPVVTNAAADGYLPKIVSAHRVLGRLLTPPAQREGSHVANVGLAAGTGGRTGVIEAMRFDEGRPKAVDGVADVSERTDPA